MRNLNRSSFRAFLLATAIAYAIACQGNAQEEKWKPIPGPVILYFVKDPMGGLAERQFGIFRDNDPPKDQFIEEVPTSLKMPGEKRDANFLVLPYNLATRFNGFWIRIKDANWEKYAKNDGEIVLLLRQLEPGKDPINRSVKIGAPDTPCLSNFKLELKVKGEGGRISYVALRQHVRPAHEAEQKDKGFFEIRVPLKDFGLDLTKVHEVVLVFEANNLVAEERRGAIGIRGVLVTSSKGQNVNEILRGEDPVLHELGVKTSQWFHKHRHPKTGLVLDRAPNRADAKINPDQPAMCSIAAVGYFLSLLPEDVRLDRLSKVQAAAQAEQTLQFVLENVEHKDGILYHFVDWRTGKRFGKSETSILDTSILINGAMVASSLSPQVSALADKLLDRANWQKYLVKHHTSKKDLLSMGWDPEKGFHGAADVRSSENSMPYFLAVASKTFPIKPEVWYNTEVRYGKLADRRILNPTHGLFTSYFGQNWHLLKGLVDRDGVDLYLNAREAALANRESCRRAAATWPTYAEEAGAFWGISAGDAPTGYVAPAPTGDDAHGIVWPMTALPALPWIPDEMMEDLHRWRASKTWNKISGPYGLAPFRLGPKEWKAPDLICIDLGSWGCSLANFRSQTVWNLWMAHPVARDALRKLEYRSIKNGEKHGATRGRNADRPLCQRVFRGHYAAA